MRQICNYEKIQGLVVLLALASLAILSSDCGNLGKQPETQAERIRNLRKIAASGLSLSQTELVKVYLEGKEGLDMNPATAFYWVLKLAEKGDSEVQYIIGLMYYRGEDIPQNKDEDFIG